MKVMRTQTGLLVMADADGELAAVHGPGPLLATRTGTRGSWLVAFTWALWDPAHSVVGERSLLLA